MRKIEVLDTFQVHYWEAFVAPTLLDCDQKARVRAVKGEYLPLSTEILTVCAPSLCTFDRCC